ncbi:hypothetical protein Bca101_006259 [Brassica carinata]
MPSERHASHPPRLDRPRLDLTVPASTHRRNHITATSFRRSSEPAEPPPKPSLLFQLCQPPSPPETRADDGEAEETTTSRKQKPAATELWKPPSPEIKTHTTSVFTTP